MVGVLWSAMCMAECSMKTNYRNCYNYEYLHVGTPSSLDLPFWQPLLVRIKCIENQQ